MMIITDKNTIDLTKHGLIEASAGTGKTYTIENLCVRMMRENLVTLDNILIVTFTEKATGELKQRIRAKIEEELKDEIEKEAMVCLQYSLDHFDQASIFTIHGFCRNLLKEFSFEIGEELGDNLVADREVFTQILRLQMRRNWPKTWGSRLIKILNFINFKSSNFESLVLEACGHIKEHASFSLEPTSDEETIHRLLEELETLCQRLSAQEVVIDHMEELQQVFGKKSAAFFNNLEKLKRYLSGEDPVLEINVDIKRAVPLKAFQNKVPSQIAALQDDFHLLLDKLADFRWLFCSVIAQGVFQEAQAFKREKGMLSYDDMLVKTEALLTGNAAKEKILEKIRKKYRFGMIDEFQDTDFFQWQIFKTIFLESSDSKLYLIGDPKQSIYRFRNADIHTYLDAKCCIEALEGKGFAQQYSLQKNYRSYKRLVEQFNVFFMSDQWFGQNAQGHAFGYIEAEGVKEWREDEEKNKNLRLPGVKLLPLVDEADDVDAKIGSDRFFELYFTQIVAEILHIKSCNPHVKYGDFCCLFETRSRMNLLKDKLIEAGIPYIQYQEVGIQKSNEALELQYLLQAIRNPNDYPSRSLALLTTFFNVKPQELSQYEDLPLDHPILRQLHRWKYWAEFRNWPKLFFSLMEETNVIQNSLQLENGERKVSNYRQILEWLLEKAVSQKLNFEDLCLTLESYRVSPVALTEEERKMRLASESNKVQLMTIHASKGLEYQYVFLCKYESKKKPISTFWIRDQQQFKIILDTKRSPLTSVEVEELKEEKKRLLYVAFTRAVHSLYLPQVPNSKDEFFQDIIAPIFETEKARFEILLLNSDSEIFCKNVSLEISEKPDTSRVPQPPIINVDRLKPDLYTQSYSSLAMTGLAEPQDVNEKDDDEAFEEKLWEQVLPKGANTGSLCHSLFENLSFALVEKIRMEGGTYVNFLYNEEVRRTFKSIMLKYSFDEQWEEVLAKVIYSTLVNKNFRFDANFSLSQLKDTEKIHELEFYYALRVKSSEAQIFIKGFIDLIFVHQGKYYILDWKSNYLDEGYEEVSLERAIREHLYDLQYKIYILCLYEWLLKRGMQKKDWASKFGGVVYYFIRGAEVNAGVYEKHLKELPTIDSIQKEVSALTSKAYHLDLQNLFKGVRE